MNSNDQKQQMYDSIVRLIQTKEDANVNLAVQTAVGTNNPIFWNRFGYLLLDLGKEHTRKLKNVLSIVKETTHCIITIPSNCNEILDFRLFPNLHSISLSVGNIRYKFSPILPSHIQYIYLRSLEEECLSSAIVRTIISGVVSAYQINLTNVRASDYVTLDASCATNFIVNSNTQDSSIFNSEVVLSKNIVDLDIGVADIKPFLNWLSSADYVHHDKVYISDTQTGSVYKLIDSQEYWDWLLEFNKERLSLL